MVREGCLEEVRSESVLKGGQGLLNEFPFDQLNSGHRNQRFYWVPGLGLCVFSRISPSFHTSFNTALHPLPHLQGGVMTLVQCFVRVYLRAMHGVARTALL